MVGIFTINRHFAVTFVGKNIKIVGNATSRLKLMQGQVNDVKFEHPNGDLHVKIGLIALGKKGCKLRDFVVALVRSRIDLQRNTMHEDIIH